MRIVNDTYDLLKPEQKVGVDFLQSRRSALLADDVGYGKTAQGVHGCIDVGARTALVICTASIKYNWRKEAIKWGVHQDDIHVVDKDTVACLPQQGMFIVNYDLIWRKPYAKFLARRKYDVLICDEAHMLKSGSAKRSKAVWLSNGYADLATYRWMLTATPMLNRPVELHPMLNKLAPERLGEYKNYIDYTRRYCDGQEGKWGWDATGATNLDELAGRLDGFMLRRVRTGHQKPELQKIYLPYSEEVRKAIFNGEENDSVRRLIGIGKIKPSAEIIKNALDSEPKIIAFTYHQNVIDGMMQELKDFNPVMVDGRVTDKNRQRAIEKFISDPTCRVFLGQIDAAGEGIDGLQHVASMGFFVEIAQNPGRIKQAIGRLDREGQTKGCLFQFLLVEDTTDEQFLDQNIFKERNIQKVMGDEDRVLKFNKKKKEEETMALPKDPMERIADALERFVDLLEKGAGAPVLAKKAIKTKGGKKPDPEKTPETPKVTVDFETAMHQAAGRISTFTGDPAKTNALFNELTSKFTAKYPEYATVMDAPPEKHEEVIAFVEAFLKEKGIV